MIDVQHQCTLFVNLFLIFKLIRIVFVIDMYALMTLFLLGNDASVACVLFD